MRASEADHRELSEIDEIVDRLLDRLGDAAVMARIIEAVKAAGLLPRVPTATQWLDANEVAQCLKLDRDWVYEHAEELGVKRFGKGPRPRLRFPPDIVDPKNQSPEASSQPATPKKPAGLIPIRGQ
jgi:hypothetical protein